MTPARLYAVILVGLVAYTQSAGAKGPRQHGDPLLVGEVVRIRLLVTEDSYFGVVACGQFQCGGIRVDGVDRQGMGFRTFLSNATNNPYRARWVVKEDNKFGTAFFPGREYTFVVSRPAEQEMRLWIEDREHRFASVKLDPGAAQLYIGFRNGDIRFIGDLSNVKTPGSQLRSLCDGTKETSIVEEEGTDILEIKVGCRYESDDKVHAMCVIYLAAEGVKGKREVYRSTFTRNEYDPQQEETLKLPFKFEENQYLIFEIYRGYSDCETPEDDLLGLQQTSLAAINTQGKVEVPFTLGASGERFSVRFQLNCDERVTLHFSGRGIGGEGYIFMEILKSPAVTGLDFEEVSQSNKVPRDIDLIIWDEMSLSVNSLCDGDYNRTIRVNVLETFQGETSLIGYFNTTLNELRQPENATFLLMNHVQQLELGGLYNHSGEIRVGEIPQNPTFSQYVAVGFELVGTTQIDFTGSNNDPVPSLHYVGDQPNEYERAIKSVGEVVENFIADGIFKAYGFGAEFQGTVSHDFSLNLDTGSPDCVGVKDMLQIYHTTVEKLWEQEVGLMSGPTWFAPGLSKVVEMARQHRDGSKYFVHLLLSDGDLHDAEETKQILLNASDLPISIIIIGIGDANFTALKGVLEGVKRGGTTGVNWNEGTRMLRDIVQFVAMRDFVAADNTNVLLRRDVLSKIPPQYLEYMKIKKIPPKRPKNTTIERYCA